MFRVQGGATVARARADECAIGSRSTERRVTGQAAGRGWPHGIKPEGPRTHRSSDRHEKFVHNEYCMATMGLG